MKVDTTKVVIIVGGFKLPDRNASAHRAIENALLLSKVGYKPIVIGKTPDESRCLVDGVECLSITGERPYNLNIDSIVEYIDFVGMNNVHSIIAYNYPPIALIKLLFYCYKNDIQLIPDLTEWYGWDNVGVIRDSIRFLATELRMRIITKFTKKIILASSFLQSKYKKKEVYILPFSTDPKRDIWQNLPAKLDAGEKVRRYIYAGSPGTGMRKDEMNLIIEAFYFIYKKVDKSRDFILNVLGISETDYLSVFTHHERIIKELHGKVIFHGRVAHHEALYFLVNSDFSILVRPQNRVSNVGFSTKIVESFACSTPVITNDTSDISKYIENEINGFLIAEKNLSEIVFTINKTLGLDASTYAEVRNNCAKYNPFLIDNYIDSFKKFIKKDDD